MYKAHELSETHRAKGKIVVKIRGTTKYSQFTCFILVQKVLVDQYKSTIIRVQRYKY